MIRQVGGSHHLTPNRTEQPSSPPPLHPTIPPPPHHITTPELEKGSKSFDTLKETGRVECEVELYDEDELTKNDKMGYGTFEIGPAHAGDVFVAGFGE